MDEPGDTAHSNTLLNSNPLENSLSFESQIVSSSPSLRGTTGRVCQSPRSGWSMPVNTEDRFLRGTTRRDSQALTTGSDSARTFPEGLIRP